jgi:tRNA(fMet)-specific endonuclease VapC
MRYLLDTNVVIALLSGRSPGIEKRLGGCDPQDVAVSAITAFELYFGAYKSAKTAFNLETLRQLFSDLQILNIDGPDGRAAGEIRASLQRLGTPIGPYDVLIAGQAKARGLTVVTHNTQEFERVEGLAVQDWTI